MVGDLEAGVSSRQVSGWITVVPSILTIAVWLWVLDILGIDVWAASRIAHFINLVAERVN